MVGDSLSADIKGGIDYGLNTCWYNPKKKETYLEPTYIISSLTELINICK